MTKRRKGPKTRIVLPEPGTVFAMQLADGRFGACRVLAQGADDVVAEASEWFGPTAPTLRDVTPWRVLVLTHHFFKSEPARSRVHDPPHDRIVRVGWRDDVFAGADRAEQRFGGVTVGSIALGAELLEHGERRIEVPFGDGSVARFVDLSKLTMGSQTEGGTRLYEALDAAFDGFAVPRRVHEVFGVEPLAHQTALHIGERHDDGVDETLLDAGGELLPAQRRPAPR